MRKKNTLSKRQLDVIEDLFTEDLNERAVLEKHNVSVRLYGKWQGEDAFIEHFEKRIAAAHRQSAALIASYAPIAAAKLVDLTQCKKEETARKACLDIIAMQPSPTAPPKPQADNPEPPDQGQQLTQKTATKILAILAEENRQSDQDS